MIKRVWELRKAARLHHIKADRLQRESDVKARQSNAERDYACRLEIKANDLELELQTIKEPANCN